MKRIKGARLIQQLIAESMIAFLEMSSNERVDLIQGFYQLLPYQQTAIIQCKKRMTAAEKKILKKTVEHEKLKNKERS